MIKNKLKFNIGDKVYYKCGSRIYNTTIKEIEIKTVYKKNKEPVTETYYTARSHKMYCYSRADRKFKEDQIFNSKDAMKKGYIPTEKKKIEKMIKQIKKSITSNKKSMKLAQERLDQIRKEELVEKLSGI